MKTSPTKDKFLFTGRIDFTNENEPLFIYPGTMAETTFTGKKLSIYVKNEAMGAYHSVGVMLDGVQYKYALPVDPAENHKEIKIDVADNLEEGEHTLTIFKRQAAAHYLWFCGIETEEGSTVALPKKEYSLNIEVYGDSVSAGEYCEQIYHEGALDDPETIGKGTDDNSWFSYPMIMGRMLNARVYDNSQGGIALFNKTGFFTGPDPEKLTGVETTYNKLSYVPYSSKGFTDWDFSNYTPDLVIMAIGQNDPNPFPEKTEDPEYIRKWKDKYKEIVCDLREKYGKKLKVLMILTVLMHDPRWDSYLDEIEQELETETGEKWAKHFTFSRCGKATPGHPRITEQYEMAYELSAEIREWFKLK